MTIRHFRVFNEVCKHMNMTQASKILHVSQPSISKTIGELEDWYGVKLFERLDKKIYLTEAGKTIYHHSVYLVDTYDKIDSEIRHSASSDLIRIGASVTVGTSILSDIISSFKVLYPDIQYRVYIENTQCVQNLLLNNDIDIALIEGHIDNPVLVTEQFMEADVVAVYSRSHPFYDLEAITVHDLETADFIIREPGSGTRIQFEKIMNDLRIPWTPTWICHNTQAIKNAVEAGHGVGVLSKLSVRRRLKNGEFKAIPFLNMKQDFYIVYHKEKFMTKMLLTFKKHIIDTFNRLELDLINPRNN